MVDEHRRLGWDQQDPSASGHALVALCGLRDPRVGSYVSDELAAAEPNWFRLDWYVLGRLGPWAAAGCRQALLHHVTTAPDGDLRLSAVEALARVSTAADADIADVVAAISARISAPVMVELRGRAARPADISRVLGDLGPAAASAVPELRPLLAHADPDVRMAAARAVFRISGDASAVLPLLRAGVEDLPLVAELGPAAAELTEPLRTRMAGDDAVTATRAAVAFWRVTGDPARVVPVLVRHLENGELGIRAGEEPSVPAARDHLRHDPLVDAKAAARLDAVRTLGEIGPAAEAALPLLRRAVTTRTRQVWTGSLTAVAGDDAWVQACARALTEIDA